VYRAHLNMHEPFFRYGIYTVQQNMLMVIPGPVFAFLVYLYVIVQDQSCTACY